MVTEAQRHQLYSELTEVLSTEGAAIIMDVVGSVTIAELATKSNIAELRSELKTDMAELKTDMAELRFEVKTDMAELKTDMAELRFEVKTDIAELRADMADLKQDLTRTFATLLFVSQGVLVSIVGSLVAII